jgi:hypothetical protein
MFSFLSKHAALLSRWTRSIFGEITLEEALECLSPGLVSQKPKNQTFPATSDALSIESCTFFHPYMLQLFSTPATIPVHCDSEDTEPPPFKTYPHPAWLYNPSSPLETPPLILDPAIILDPTPETLFRSAMFRLMLVGNLIEQPIYQGTRIIFKGFEQREGFHVVEWCQLKGNHAYLKVVGWRYDRHPFPYNDPYCGSFILIVPTHVNQVKPHPACAW